ncbi:MAG: cytochrome c maturation protein CcmE [Oligoflexia bacterium]|nr:cytochrome c maturation protein CcmE [Oligoflexia bacterium]
MNKTFIYIVCAVALIAVGLIVWATKEAAAMVLMPSQILGQPEHQDLSRIRVAGRVAPEAIDYTVSPTAELKFSIHDPGGSPEKIVPVVYRGLKPDMFAPGRDVIIDGSYANGVLQAEKLLTQCPSKYEPPLPGKNAK